MKRTTWVVLFSLLFSILPTWAQQPGKARKKADVWEQTARQHEAEQKAMRADASCKSVAEAAERLLDTQLKTITFDASEIEPPEAAERLLDPRSEDFIPEPDTRAPEQRREQWWERIFQLKEVADERTFAETHNQLSACAEHATAPLRTAKQLRAYRALRLLGVYRLEKDRRDARAFSKWIDGEYKDLLGKYNGLVKDYNQMVKAADKYIGALEEHNTSLERMLKNSEAMLNHSEANAQFWHLWATRPQPPPWPAAREPLTCTGSTMSIGAGMATTYTRCY